MLVIVHKLLETSALLSLSVLEAAGRVTCVTAPLQCRYALEGSLGVGACGWAVPALVLALWLAVLFGAQS